MRIMLEQLAGSDIAAQLADAAIKVLNSVAIDGPLALVAIEYGGDDGGDSGEVLGFGLSFITTAQLSRRMAEGRDHDDVLFHWHWPHTNYSVDPPVSVNREATVATRGTMAAGSMDGLDAKIALFDEVARCIYERRDQIATELATDFGVFVAQGENLVDGAIESLTYSAGEHLVGELRMRSVLP